MTEVEAKKPQETLQDRLAQVVELLQRYRLGEDLEYRQDGLQGEPGEEPGQILVELQRKLDELHPADVAHILEALPLDERLTVWQLVKAERDGDILLEVSDAVRETLIATWTITSCLPLLKKWTRTSWPTWRPNCRVTSSTS